MHIIHLGNIAKYSTEFNLSRKFRVELEAAAVAVASQLPSAFWQPFTLYNKTVILSCLKQN